MYVFVVTQKPGQWKDVEQEVFAHSTINHAIISKRNGKGRKKCYHSFRLSFRKLNVCERMKI